jgi:hypothetical protein
MCLRLKTLETWRWPKPAICMFAADPSRSPRILLETVVKQTKKLTWKKQEISKNSTCIQKTKEISAQSMQRSDHEANSSRRKLTTSIAIYTMSNWKHPYSFAELDSRDNKWLGSSCTKNNTNRKSDAVRNIYQGNCQTYQQLFSYTQGE